MLQLLRAHLAERQEAFLADLESLVKIDSGSHDKAGVDRAVTAFEGLLERTGFAVQRFPLREYGDCLLGRLAGRGTARILLIGHLDTVFPAGTAAERPFQVQDGRILGPGTSDMKGGLVAGIHAVAALQALGFDDFGEIAFFCNSEEEIGSPASRDLYRAVAAASHAALVLESARHDGAIVLARKGGAHYRLIVHGRAAHAGVEPEKGANAVVELARLVLALQQLNDVRPGATVNVCTVRGGTRSNVVPDFAEADVDARVLCREDIPALDTAVRELIRQPGLPGTQRELAGGSWITPMGRTAATDLLFQLARQVARDLGFELQGTTTGGISDGNRIAQLGTPVLDGLGPVGGLDHSPQEYVELASVVPRTALLAGLIIRIVEHQEPLRQLAAGSSASGGAAPGKEAPPPARVGSGGA